ncbi:transport and golgi organization 9 isoform X2 [Brevipalpus obovatus]
MAFTSYQVFLAIVMVATGSINTLATKWADRSEAPGRDGVNRPFNHPYVQAAGMFLGELSCLLAFRLLYCHYKRKDYTDDQLPPSIKGNQSFKRSVFALPAICDMLATSTMYVGLGLTYASSFQMLRGSLIIFTGILSIIFLNRKLKMYEYLGILFVIAGLTVVGVADMKSSGETKDAKHIIIGDVLIILAQIVTAVQMVLEEKFVNSQEVSPLQAVGWEGLFGFLATVTLLVPMYFIYVGQGIFTNPYGQIEDVVDAFFQIKNSWQVALGFLGTIVSIAFFNFAGVSVTKEISATTRTVLDSIRTFVIKVIGVSLSWEKIDLMQAGGFGLLVIGMFLYNDVLIRPCLMKLKSKKPDDTYRDENRPLQQDQLGANDSISSAGQKVNDP